jgi:PKD repeat protein
MTLVETYLPFGIRDVKITPFIGELGVGTPVDLPVGRVVTFRETENVELLKSDDRNVAMEGTGAIVEWELEAGGISFEAWQILTGASLVTGVGFRELIKLDTDVRPYFVIEGQSINDDGTDLHILIRRCKVNGSVEGTFEDGQFFLTKCEGLGIGDSTGELWRMRWNANPTEVFGGVRALPNTISLLARPMTISVGNVVAGVLAPAVSKVEANKLQVGIGTEIIIAMQPKTATWSAVPFSTTGGVGALSLVPKTLALSARPLTINTGINLIPKTFAMTAQPLLLGTTSTTIEAEAGTVEGNAQIISEFPGYTGTGYIGFFGLTGDVNQINFSAASAGNYTFSINFGNAHQPPSNTLVNIRVNGSIQGQITLQNTASDWSNPARFVQSTAITIPFNTGNNIIRIEHAGLENTYADLNSYTIGGAGTGGGGGTPPPPTGDGTQVDMLALFKTKYPAGGGDIWVDGALGNDGNAGGTTSPKATIQAAINAASAGSNIMVRPYGPGYGAHSFENKAGTASNYIRMISSPTGAKINANGGSYNTSCATNCFGGNSHHIAIYGFEYAGINSSGAPYEVGVSVANGSHDVAVWKCYFHDLASHAMALPGDSGQGFSGSDKFDFCYNRLTKIARWNPFQSSGFSSISMANLGTAWPDGYHNHIIGNVIDGCGTDNSRPDPTWGITDGNCIIFDYSGGYSGRTLAAHNLCVGAGGRGIHDLGTNNVDIWLNTTCDNSWNIAGTWIGEISVTESASSRAQYNVCAARVGNNRVSIFYNSTNSIWGDTVYLRGSGGSDSGDISVNANNNVNKLSVGPSGYFQAYQAGSLHNTVITNIPGFRPTTANVAIFQPPAEVRSAVGSWPDALNYLRPTTGAWAYGAFEASTATSPGGNPGSAPVAAFTNNPTTAPVNTSVQFTDQSTNTPSGWAWNFGDGNTSTLQNPSKSYPGAATYTVSLTASNAVGASAPVSHNVVITAVSGGGGGTPDYVVGVNGSLQQILDLPTSQLANRRILVPTGLWLGGDHGVWIVNKDFGGVVVEFQSGAILRGPGTSGIELYGSSRNITLTGPGKIQGNGGNTVSEGIFISSVQPGKGGDTNPGGNITIDGLTIEPTPGTGSLQRNGIGIWGCDWVTVRNCTIHDASSNAAFGFGGAGSGISIGAARRGVAGSGQYHVLLENNHVYNQLMVQDGPSADRNGIIFDLFQMDGGFQNFAGLYSDRLIGECMIRNNDIHDVSGRGIQILFGGQPDTRINILNNQVHGQWARDLGGSDPQTAIGGNGSGVCENIVCSNNTVTRDSGNGNKPAYFFFDFNPGTGVTGQNNHLIGGGLAYDWHNSPGTAPPAGFIT